MALLVATSSRVFKQRRPLACQTSRAVMRNRSGVLVLAVCEDALDGLDVLQEGNDNRDVVLRSARQGFRHQPVQSSIGLRGSRIHITYTETTGGAYITCTLALIDRCDGSSCHSAGFHDIPGKQCLRAGPTVMM